MPISGLLFGTTHSVEQITNIKSKKKVDKILLKVVKVIKAKGKLDGWVKPTASLSKDLKLSDKTILSIMKTLGAYYQIDLTAKKLDTPMAIATEIKVKKPKVVNSLYLVDIDEMEVDVDDDVQPENVPDDPGMSVPKPEPAPLEEPHVEPAVPDPLPAESETPPNSGAVIGTVEGELQEDPANVEQSESTGEVTPDEQTADAPETTSSTEGLSTTAPQTPTSWGSFLNNL